MARTKRDNDTLVKEIQAKMGEKHLRRVDVWFKMSPVHVAALTECGEKIARGFYSLEKYFGATDFTPVPEDMLKAEPAEKRTARAPKEAKPSDEEKTKKLVEEIKAKFGTKHLKSGTIFRELSPRHLNALRAVGTELRFGYWSLEPYFGEAETPMPEKVAKQPKSADKASEPVKTAGGGAKTQFETLDQVREAFEAAGFETIKKGTASFENQFGEFTMAHGFLYRSDLNSPTGVSQASVEGILQQEVGR